MPVRVLVAEANPILRERLRLLLGEAVEVVGETSHGAGAVRLVAERRPDVALVALDLPDLDGIETTRRIKTESPRTRVILMTGHGEDAYLAATGKTGADALVSKRRLSTDLVGKVRQLGGVVRYWNLRYWNVGERRGRGGADARSRWDGVERRGGWPPDAS